MIEKRLLWLASAFVAVYALALTLSPAAREHSWQVDYRWMHWLSVGAWIVLTWLAHGQLNRRLPERDPYLFPAAALLSGWGMLAIWRLLPEFGMRQAAWLTVGLAILILGVRLPSDLGFLWRFKYVWLSAGLLLTAATLFLGTNPLGAGPQLWLGCCGLYMQPSELLKLLLIVYLSAYLADRMKKRTGVHGGWLPLLLPTLMVTGLALLLLVVQRDLGTASIFLGIYATFLYLATGKKRILLLAALGLALSAVVGYARFDVVRLRIDAWLNPWLEPTTRSYQIVQSLIAVASGGAFGRGVGMGSPGLVPVSQSDFIYAAVAEEMGLVGALGLLLLLGWLVTRGMRAALYATTPFQRFLAAGIALHLGVQSILIVGGNLRLLPLTGVTLPFVSYGGSSLVTSLVEVLLLLLISQRQTDAAVQIFNPQPYRQVGSGVLLGLAACGLAAGWWSAWRGPDLAARTDNVRRVIADRYVQRGAILSQDGTPIAVSEGESGSYQRSYEYTELGAILGYTDPYYGQAGLEASLDDYLRGLQGNSQLAVWWNHLVYGQPPPGLDVRLSLDLDLQRHADELLGDHKGALVLLNAESGEILAMASHPGFDANLLEQTWEGLVNDPDASLVNRATQGLYPGEAGLGSLLLAAQTDPANLPDAPEVNRQDCALLSDNNEWGAQVKAGCQAAVEALAERLGSEGMKSLVERLGFTVVPELFLTAEAATQEDDTLLVSPLQMSLAAAALSNSGVRPPPRLALAVNTPQSGWVILPPLSEAVTVYSSEAAQSASQMLSMDETPAWQSMALVYDEEGKPYSWFLGGTLPTWPGAPLALAVLIEEDDPQGVTEIGETLLNEAMQP
jgi:cell division protein FtsW (lipid II flippase)